jgi:hypothetical protein
VIACIEPDSPPKCFLFHFSSNLGQNAPSCYPLEIVKLLLIVDIFVGALSPTFKRIFGFFISDFTCEVLLYSFLLLFRVFCLVLSIKTSHFQSNVRILEAATADFFLALCTY